VLRSALPGLGFVFLELTPEVGRRPRVSHRPGHFMPSTLIESQFATLESPVGEPLTLALDASIHSVDELALQAHVWWLGNGLKRAGMNVFMQIALSSRLLINPL
jgi:gluconokinase